MSHYQIQAEKFDEIEKDIKIAFVRSEFNEGYTKALQDINKTFLEENSFTNIETFLVPGALEIPGFVNKLLSKKSVDIVICIGVVIEGATPHFDHVCRESARGIMDLTMKYNIPIINGVLTCHNEKQVEERIKNVYAISALKTLKAYQKI